MWTWNGLDTLAAPGTAGIPFQFGSLTAAEQTALDSGDPTPFNANRLNYLRGVRTLEINSLGVGTFRARNGVGGDIVDASPTSVAPPVAPYNLKWLDRYVPADTMLENSGQSYTTFQTSNQSRLNVIYAGANDGFLHGFESGSEDIKGN